VGTKLVQLSALFWICGRFVGDGSVRVAESFLTDPSGEETMLESILGLGFVKSPICEELYKETYIYLKSLEEYN
jgi:hypothetical protein